MEISIPSTKQANQIAESLKSGKPITYKNGVIEVDYLQYGGYIEIIWTSNTNDDNFKFVSGYKHITTFAILELLKLID